MKRTFGLILLALSAVVAFVTAYWLWTRATVVTDPRRHAEQLRISWMLAGLLFLAAGNVFLLGLCLLRANPERGIDGMPPDRRNPFPFPLYLATSVTLALFASFIEIVRSQLLGFLWTFLCVPSILLQFTGLHLRVPDGHPVLGPFLIVDFYLVYYLGLLFPLYRRRYRLAQVLIGIHLALGLLLLVAILLIIRSE